MSNVRDPAFASFDHAVTRAALSLEDLILHSQLRWLEAKAGYNPDQPRVPSGNSDGGRWTGGGGNGSVSDSSSIGRLEGGAATDRVTGSTANRSSDEVINKEEGITVGDRPNPRFKGMGDTQIKKQKFVDAHLADTEAVAKQLNVPVGNILGLSALESKWGIGDFVHDGPTEAESTNSYFSMHAPAPFMDGSTRARQSDAVVAGYANYEDSLKSFVEKNGHLIQNISDPVQFATVLQLKAKFGILPDGSYDPTYVPKLASIIKHISSAITFSKKHPK